MNWKSVFIVRYGRTLKAYSVAVIRMKMGKKCKRIIPFAVELSAHFFIYFTERIWQRKIVRIKHDVFSHVSMNPATKYRSQSAFPDQ